MSYRHSFSTEYMYHGKDVVDGLVEMFKKYEGDMWLDYMELSGESAVISGRFKTSTEFFTWEFVDWFGDEITSLLKEGERLRITVIAECGDNEDERYDYSFYCNKIELRGSVCNYDVADGLVRRSFLLFTKESDKYGTSWMDETEYEFI